MNELSCANALKILLLQTCVLVLHLNLYQYEEIKRYYNVVPEHIIA